MVTKSTMSNAKYHPSRLGLLVALVLGCLAPAFVAHAATLSLSPSTGVYTAGATFTTRVVVNTAGEPINAAEATLRFNPSELSVVSLQKGSTFTLWAVEPSYSNSAGTISFGGGSPSGYTGSAGTVLSITWRTKGAGTSRVSFANGSVLAADGRGTNVVDSLNGGSYTVAAADVQPEPEVIEYVAPANTPPQPQITSRTHASDGWATSTTATLQWTLPGDVTGVRTLLDGNSGSIPTKVYETAIDSITLEDLTPGVQYFHLQFRNTNGWGRVAHYRLAVDTEAPSAFTITRSDTYDRSSPTQQLDLHVTDATSPVNRYLVQHNDGEPYEYIDETGSSTLTVSELEPGSHSFIIEAFDAAGNSRVATLRFDIEAFSAPAWTEYPTEVSTDVVPVLFGSTRPDAEVFVTVTPLSRGEQGSLPMEYSIQADQNGDFQVVPDGRLASGVYEITAYAVDPAGSRSAQSEAIRISVTPPGYLAIGSWAVSVMSVLVPLVALAVLLILVVLYGYSRIRNVRRVVVAETSDALAVLDSQFGKLRETLTADADALGASRKNKKLTKAEQQLVDDMHERVDAAEAALKKEIAEVDDIVST